MRTTTPSSGKPGSISPLKTNILILSRRTARRPSFSKYKLTIIGTALNLKRCLQIFFLAISLLVTSLPVSAHITWVLTLSASALERVSDDQFVFGKVDLDLLSEIELLDEHV